MGLFIWGCSGGKGVQEQLLKDLHVRIQKVFEECENDSSSNPTTLSMLTDLEVRDAPPAVLIFVQKFACFFLLCSAGGRLKLSTHTDRFYFILSVALSFNTLPLL